MKVWRNSSKDTVGLLIIGLMLSVSMAVVVFLMLLSFNTGIDKPSEANRREKVEQSGGT